MTEDVVSALGWLTLGTRLKRLGERLQGETDAILRDRGIALAASQYPYLASLDRLGEASLGELAAAVGVTQPGATRAVNGLVRDGLLRAVRSTGDQRRKVLTLTEAGRMQVARGKGEVWPLVEAAVAEIGETLEGSLLEQLRGMEAELERASLLTRTTRMTRGG